LGLLNRSANLVKQSINILHAKQIAEQSRPAESWLTQHVEIYVDSQLSKGLRDFYTSEESKKNVGT
jgi:hypothetical protein